MRFEVRALLFALRRLTRTPRAAQAMAAARAALGRLAALVLEPLALPPHSGLVVVPVGELQRVPWAALHDTPVTVAPAAASSARTAARPAPDGPVVLVAGPDVPGGAEEVGQLAALHPDAVVLRPPESTAAAVTAALSGAGLAHLACHGRIRPDNPIFSALLLSGGPLTVHELELRGPAPHRIVLAACESGSEVGYAGNETLGFVSSLLARGTAGLVASAVVVPDADVVPLMHGLHAAVLDGASLAEALFRARAGLDLTEPGAFVSWCAFNAFGAG
ncbi:MAG: hypothetical protein AVDCRST_MAG41-926 [uncultured Corynebacteriales bacterium]|uniref:CHAT domain-containing protein n=1 Tax=uncultured Mycobacteriales bacterium TaxID=581187 RepID=A0A6J4HSF2_9ACTN|nr:MAG: hypothetical protein AVDCRST_MAG41-926 [uncultured Corynebacteriales bacterium]